MKFNKNNGVAGGGGGMKRYGGGGGARGGMKPKLSRDFKNGDTGKSSEGMSRGFKQNGGYNNRNSGGFTDRNSGGFNNRNGGGFSNRNSGGFSNRNSGGFNKRGSGGFTNRNSGGFNNRNSGGRDGGFRPKNNSYGKFGNGKGKFNNKGKFANRKFDDENVEIKEEVDVKEEETEGDDFFQTVDNNSSAHGNGVKKEEFDEDDDDENVGGRGNTGGGKKGRNKKKMGGFQGMGLSPPVLKGVLRRGYNIPTPIQRKAIPPILEGRDVVAMARTGSGKTASFLIPMFEKLQVRKASIGTSSTKFPRALILSPTRELATQTVKFIREIGKFLDFKVIGILGGESMERQFQLMHDKPDIVVATPGRFMHLCVEMELKLDGVEYVVFDEADRLFEMGFGEQLSEILKRLPENRQTVMFSATLPKLLVEFSKAGLHDPTLIRLDVDIKLPDRLALTYLACRSEDKLAALIYLLKNVIDESHQTIVFAATKHHVEFLHQLLDEANISNCYIYSSLDPAARKISLGKFRSGKCNVMVVTDIAARGIDIPILDNVVNFHFPAKPKLFMHRVGRVARAGRSGTAYSILSPEEIAFLIDLHLFLDKPLVFQRPDSSKEGDDESKSAFVGRIPQDLLNDESNFIRNMLEIKMELSNLHKVSKNGYQQYLKSRPNASVESNRRAKGLEISKLQVHPLFSDHIAEDPMDNLISQMQGYRPNATIFEIGPKAGSETQKIMKMKRSKDQNVVERYRAKRDMSDVETIAEKAKAKAADDDSFIPYRPKDHHTELGLSVGTTFDKQVQEAVMDLTGDDSDMLKQQHSMMKWDQKKKKFVSMGKDTNGKKIKTESGVWIAASYKSDRYKSWMQKSKADHQDDDGDDDEDGMGSDNFTRRGSDPSNRRPAFSRKLVKSGKNEAVSSQSKVKGRRFKTELKRPEQILKQRKDKEKKMQKNLPKNIRKKRGREGGGKGKGGGNKGGKRK